jgi:hypothetical protein
VELAQIDQMDSYQVEFYGQTIRKKMKLFLDTEFNGFSGELMSMALVPEDTTFPQFYVELEIKSQLDPWVRDNVVPHMFLSPITRSEFQAELVNYLITISFHSPSTPLIIVADWPDDIRYFCESLITGPGLRLPTPSVIQFELDMNIKYVSEIPHNALHDARGIREAYKK